MSSTDEAGPAIGRKLKMLCLHGFLQNSDIFRMRIGSMRKGLKSRVEFCFQDAPFHAASTLTEKQISELGGGSNGLTWFQWQDLGPDKRPSLAVKYSHWDDTYRTLCSAMKEHQPDVIFGFSQGATAAALFLAALQTAQRQGQDVDVPLPKGCVVCSGFLPRDPEYVALLEAAKVDVPALFVIGDTDSIIPPARSHTLMDTFLHSTTDLFQHPGAHMVPTCTGDFKQAMAELQQRLDAEVPRNLLDMRHRLDKDGNRYGKIINYNPSHHEEEQRQKQLKTFCGLLLERHEDDVIHALTSDKFQSGVAPVLCQEISSKCKGKQYPKLEAESDQEDVSPAVDDAKEL
eukprot:gene6901-7117_t